MERNGAGLTEAEFLANYNPGDYERPSVTVDMMVLRVKQDFSCLQILLIKRKDHPFINCFALPGGFINMRESAYEAACRELQEETGLTNIYLEQIYTMSKPDRDPRMRVIDIAYAALLPFGYQANVKAGDEIAIINIPSIKLNTVVVESIEKQYLNHYVCHFENTAMPGEYGNFSLAGHSSYRYNEVFNELHKISLDDEIIIKTLNNEFT